MKYAPSAILVLFACTALSAGRAQEAAKKVLLPGENPQVAPRLRAVDRLVDPLHAPDTLARLWGNTGGIGAPVWLQAVTSLAGDAGRMERWDRATEEYQRLIFEAGDALAAAPMAGIYSVYSQSVQVRRLCHERLARLPPTLLDRYRQRVDPQAKVLWQQGERDRDPGPLRRLLQDLFCSSYGDRALDLLGDLAFEKGSFHEALSWWRVLGGPMALAGTPPHPPFARGGRGGLPLEYPDPKVFLPLVGAKQILALIFLDEYDQAKKDLETFRLLHPEAEGTLAGRSGKYSAILDEVLKQVSGRAPGPMAEPWSTFGGGPARQRMLPFALPARLWVDGPTWKAPLPELGADADNASFPGRDKGVFFHPVIADDQVLLANSQALYSYDLATGQQRFRFKLPPAQFARDVGEGQPPGRDLSFTLSVARGRAFLRLGSQRFGPMKDDDKVLPNYLVCVDLSLKDGLADENREIWRIAGKSEAGEQVFFEGAPLSYEGRVFVAASTLAGKRTQTKIHCYDADTGGLLWVQEVCDCPEFDGQEAPRWRQHLLTLTGRQLVYCSHAGAVAALDPWTGKRLWGLRYLSRGRKTAEGELSPRGLAPCVFGEGRLYLAPQDTGSIFCLEAETGRVLWERDGIEVVHLLGVAGGRLIFTTPAGLRALGSQDGSDGHGWMQAAGLPGLGRGLLAGGWVFWPQQNPESPLRVVTVADGSQEADPRTMPGWGYEATQLRAVMSGNMAFGQGCLIVAGREELAAYVAPERLLKSYQEALNKEGATPANLYRLARAQAAAGATAEALTTFDSAFHTSLASNLGNTAAWHKLIQARKQELQPAIVAVPSKNGAEVGPAKVYPKPWSLEATRLDLPLERAWEASGVALPVDYPEDDVFLLEARNQVTCRDGLTGKIRWSRTLKFSPGWGSRWADQVLFAGGEGIEAVDAANGKRRWDYASPTQGKMWAALVDDRPVLREEDGALSGFRLSAARLFFFHQKRRLGSVDVRTGKADWRLWAPGSQMGGLTNGGQFQPHFHASDPWVLVRTNSGPAASMPSRCWVLEGANVKVLHDVLWLGPPWKESPLPLDEKNVVVTGDKGSVVLFNVAVGKEIWRYDPPWPTSSTGEASRIFGRGEVLLALAPRNYGYELERLDPATGRAMWEMGSVLLREDLPPSCLAWDTTQVYLAGKSFLQCRSLADGRLVWEQALPATKQNWRVFKTSRALLVYPGAEEGVPWLPLAGSWISWPVACLLASRELAVPTARSDPLVGFMLVVNPDDGTWLQRLWVPLRVGQALLRPGAAHVALTGGGRTWVWTGATPSQGR